MRTGVVVPVGPGREANVEACLRALDAQEEPVGGVVVVFDGEDALCSLPEVESAPVIRFVMPKHQPGMEQPRNVGVRVLERQFNEHTPWHERISHVWFLDSDVVIGPDCHEAIIDAHAASPEERVIACPYDWLAPGVRPDEGVTPEWLEVVSRERSDCRWVSFDEYGPQVARRDDLAAGLACFSGNLVWPIPLFKRVGGFWNELHHGRCEDGELGLRAVAMGVPIGFAAEARGWHLYHDVNVQLHMERNQRDVPMINRRHPWVEGSDLFVVEEDGKRFDVRCGVCGWEGNTGEWWRHVSEAPFVGGAPCKIAIPVKRDEFNF